MAQPYVGEIRMFAGNFAPSGWAICDGQILPTLLEALGHLGEAVTRQVDQHQPAAEVEEIELPRVAGLGRDARQGRAAGERVDEARLADV